MASRRVAPLAAVIGQILDSSEVASFVSELDEARWTGRRGFGARACVGAVIAKSLYGIACWTKVAALIQEHEGLRAALGGAPSHWALYRFCNRLRAESPKLQACLDRLLDSLRDAYPDMARDVALDGSDMAAWSNGQKRIYNNGPLRERFSDGDASWGHRSAIGTRSGGGYFGFKIHSASCVRTGLPVAWEVRTAKESEHTVALPVLDSVIARGFRPEHLIADKGYDSGPFYDACEARGVRPIIPLRRTGRVVQGDHGAPTCEHGRWTFAGADFKRKATKWRCPTGQCQPKSRWIKADRRHTLVPRKTQRWRDLYRARSAVEREFALLKTHYALTPLRVRGLAKVALHVDLTMLARLSLALARARAVPLAA